MIVDVRRAADRFVTRGPGVQSLHSFSFGAHYDPGNTSFGPLVAHNDEHLEAGSGFPSHPHRDLEIVSWVVEGELLHDDDAGHRGVAGPGTVQRLSAGAGVVHSERCEVPTRVVQAWLLPDSRGGRVRYGTATVEPAALRDRLATVASATGQGLEIDCRGAALLAGRLGQGVTVTLPDAARRHVFVVLGAVRLGTGQALDRGDAARLTGGGAVDLAATRAAEVLVWVMDDTP